MPITQQPVNKEAIRILVADLGYNETSTRTGIKAPTLRKWAERGKWNVATRTDERVTLVTQSPAQAHAEALAELNGKTRLGLASYASQQAQHLSTNGKLKDHNAFRNITAGAAQLHGWNEAKNPNTILNVAILTGQERPERIAVARNVDSECQGSGD